MSEPVKAIEQIFDRDWVKFASPFKLFFVKLFGKKRNDGDVELYEFLGKTYITKCIIKPFYTKAKVSMEVDKGDIVYFESETKNHAGDAVKYSIPTKGDGLKPLSVGYNIELNKTED